MSGDFDNWDNRPAKNAAPKPTYHWLEKKRGDRARLAVKWLAVLGILLYIALHLMGVIH